MANQKARLLEMLKKQYSESKVVRVQGQDQPFKVFVKTPKATDVLQLHGCLITQFKANPIDGSISFKIQTL